MVVLDELVGDSQFGQRILAVGLGEEAAIVPEHGGDQQQRALEPRRNDLEAHRAILPDDTAARRAPHLNRYA